MIQIIHLVTTSGVPFYCVLRKSDETMVGPADSRRLSALSPANSFSQISSDPPQHTSAATKPLLKTMSLLARQTLEKDLG